MDLRYAHLCDFFTQGQNGKLIFVGVFDIVYRRSTEGSVPLPPCWLLAAIDADFAEGSDHFVELRVVNEDGQEVMARTTLVSQFQSLGPGRPIRAVVGIHFPNFALPDVGDFHFEYFVDGQLVGEMPLYAVEQLLPEG